LIIDGNNNDNNKRLLSIYIHSAFDKR